MPQLPASFSAYPVSVTLDGSGNGAVRFQAVGSHIRITNRSVRVSSTTAQATVTTYKGQIGSDYRIDGTNSGSTGDNSTTPIDLFDGESIIVVWEGGDPGATATATFTGKQIPFDAVGNGDGGQGWNNPIAAGDGSLIYPALKSPNFVTAVMGWKIDRDGNAEFNDILVRGDLIVTGEDGSYISILRSDGLNLIPYIRLMPPDPTGTADYVSGFIVADEVVSGGPDQKATLLLGSPCAGGSTAGSASIILRSEGQVSGEPARVEMGDNFYRNVGGTVYPGFYGQMGNTSVNVPASTSPATPASVTKNIVFDTPFPAGTTPLVFCNISTPTGATRYLIVRGYSPTETDFTIWVSYPAQTLNANIAAVNNVPIQWVAIAPVT